MASEKFYKLSGYLHCFAFFKAKLKNITNVKKGVSPCWGILKYLKEGIKHALIQLQRLTFHLEQVTGDWSISYTVPRCTQIISIVGQSQISEVKNGIIAKHC